MKKKGKKIHVFGTTSELDIIEIISKWILKVLDKRLDYDCYVGFGFGMENAFFYFFKSALNHCHLGAQLFNFITIKVWKTCRKIAIIFILCIEVIRMNEHMVQDNF